MIGTIFLWIVGLVVGWRRGIIDARAVGAILAFGLLMMILGITGTLSMKPWLGSPGPLVWLLVFLSYVLPLFIGYAIGMAARKQRLANDRRANGPS